MSLAPYTTAVANAGAARIRFRTPNANVVSSLREYPPSYIWRFTSSCHDPTTLSRLRQRGFANRGERRLAVPIRSYALVPGLTEPRYQHGRISRSCGKRGICISWLMQMAPPIYNNSPVDIKIGQNGVIIRQNLSILPKRLEREG